MIEYKGPMLRTLKDREFVLFKFSIHLPPNPTVFLTYSNKYLLNE